MFEQIVGNISGLRGVLYVCLYKDGKQLASSFPDEQNESIIKTAEIIEQAFSALESIQKSHSEMYFSVDGKYLAVYKLHEAHFAILLTEKKINFPLIHMGIKSASEKIRHILDDQKKERALAEAQKLSVVSSTAMTVQTNSALVATLDQYSAVLTSFLGPAARFVVDDCVDAWKQKHTQTEENLPFLIKLIQQELDSDDEKEKFAQQVQLMTGRL